MKRHIAVLLATLLCSGAFFPSKADAAVVLYARHHHHHHHHHHHY